MKKSFIILSAIAATFAACTQNEEIVKFVDEPVAIGFNTDWVNNVTRNAGEMTTSTLPQTGNTMKVWGWKTYNSTATSVFNGQVVTYNQSSSQSTTKWEYSPLKFWDKSASYDFYAVAPAKDNASTPADIPWAISTAKIISVTGVPAVQVLNDLNGNSKVTTSTAVDYLVAPSIHRDSPKGNASDGDVEFTFNHILSKLIVNALTTTTFNNTGSNYPQINLMSFSIKLNGMCGTYTEKTAGAVTASATAGDAWSVASSTATSYTCFNALGTSVSEANGLLSTTALNVASYLVAPTATGATPASFTGENAYSVTVKYRVNYSASETEVFERTVTLDEKLMSFVQNTQYTLNVTIGPEAIFFDVLKVNDWTAADAVGITIE